MAKMFVSDFIRQTPVLMTSLTMQWRNWKWRNWFDSWMDMHTLLASRPRRRASTRAVWPGF